MYHGSTILLRLRPSHTVEQLQGRLLEAREIRVCDGREILGRFVHAVADAVRNDDVALDAEGGDVSDRLTERAFNTRTQPFGLNQVVAMLRDSGQNR